MAEESYLLVSLEEEKSKKLAQVISNPTSRKILDFMGKHGKTVTETEISKALSLPVSTVNYNMKHLFKAGLIKTDEYHYSEKGKEVNHYSLSNKMIIIAPSVNEKFMEKLKKILPVALLAVVAAGFIQFFSKYMTGTQSGASFATKAAVSEGVLRTAAPVAEPAAEFVSTGAKAGVQAAAPSADAMVSGTSAVLSSASDAAAGAANVVVDNATNVLRNATDAMRPAAQQAVQPAAEPAARAVSSTPYAAWFLFGAIFTLILYFVWDWVRDKNRK